MSGTLEFGVVLPHLECHPGPSASPSERMATSLDLVSKGRLRLLLGAGWFEPEYRSFGYEFSSPGRRVEELEDTLRICRAMFDAEGRPVSHEGMHHRIEGVTNVPAPKRRIPIGVGAHGDRMLDLVARLADEWNYPALALDVYEQRAARLRDRLDVYGREVRRSTQIVFSPGTEPAPPELGFFRPDLGITGSRQEMVDRTGELAAAGIEGFYGYVAHEAALEAMADVLGDLRAAVS